LARDLLLHPRRCLRFLLLHLLAVLEDT